jgi:hypothetical protein
MAPATSACNIKHSFYFELDELLTFQANGSAYCSLGSVEWQMSRTGVKEKFRFRRTQQFY